MAQDGAEGAFAEGFVEGPAAGEDGAGAEEKRGGFGLPIHPRCVEYSGVPAVCDARPSAHPSHREALP